MTYERDPHQGSVGASPALWDERRRSVPGDGRAESAWMPSCSWRW